MLKKLVFPILKFNITIFGIILATVNRFTTRDTAKQ